MMSTTTAELVNHIHQHFGNTRCQVLSRGTKLERVVSKNQNTQKDY